ncbi:glycosyltransferase [Salinibacterium sp. SYSU T00001]|uniref:glycosyltransferase n=1 Tax=Homoserinimonas sedimenticola TaxID=2986805 RepID=UPI0022366507|nr:glycosyltransferase [Salinibacterium sedimenticola]MCW4385511.1 glycosyltransferase [Salinibacterium sedimenticola]
MRLMLLTAGSRGDVEPFAALARHAASAGHEVFLGVPDNSGVELPPVSRVPLDVDFSQLVADQGVSAVAAARAFGSVIRPAMGRMLGAAVRAVLDVRPDAVVYHPKLLTAAAAASAVGAVPIVVETVPTLTPSRAFPMPGTVSRSLGPLNRVTYRAGGAAAGLFRREIAEALAPLGRPASPEPSASLIPVSPVLLERPADWPATTTITGAWVAPSEESGVDDELSAFLEGGPLLYAGFGSMAAGDPVARASAVIAAARAAGLRALIATGWGGLEVPPGARGDDVFAVESAPHARVLPSAAVAIHHGGAGTAHAVVRAGVPSVVVPFIADQPFWARQLHERGLAAAPIPARRVTAERLAHAIAAARDLQPATTAAAETMRHEHGTARALEIIEAEASDA